jgi:membrane protein YdbS with pleckstrin-like domain
MRKLSTPRGATIRSGAVQVGEFAVGVVVAYLAVATAWVLSGSVWSLAVAAAALASLAVVIEVRFGPKATGLVVGLLPTALVAGGLLIAMSQVLYRID